MYYVIPAWYGRDKFWQSDLTPWYFSRPKLEFDDSLHQIRIFQVEDKSPRMLLLAYQPHLRYFLHRQDVFEVDYYNVFDDIQGIPDLEMRPLQLADLSWSDDCDFIYTPFVVVVEKQHERHAIVEFGLEGYISQVRYFKDGLPSRELLFDDRGFVSSILFFDNGEPSLRHYLNAEGDWQICEYFDERGIVVNPKVSHRFNRKRYAKMEDIIWEFLANELIDQMTEEDLFVIASDTRHNQALYELLPYTARKILTCFVERNQVDPIGAYADLLPETQVIISDRKDFANRLKEAFPKDAYKIHQLPSYDTRLALGKSQRVRESKIFYQADRTEDDKNLYQVLKYVASQPLTEVTFGRFNATPDEMARLEEQVNRIIDNKLAKEALVEGTSQQGAENNLEENQETEYRYSFVNLVDETELIKALEYTRLIVDMSLEPNLYTQIAGISAGIPQVNRVASEYVTHKENGYILEKTSDFDKAADYFLDGLKHWNDALIDSITKIRENTGEHFINRLENWLKEDTHAK